MGLFRGPVITYSTWLQLLHGTHNFLLPGLFAQLSKGANFVEHFYHFIQYLATLQGPLVAPAINQLGTWWFPALKSQLNGY